MKQTNVNINIRSSLIQALGTTDKIKGDIAKIFNSNPIAFYKAFSKEGGFKGDILFEIHPVKHYESLEMVCGIVEHAYDTNNFTNVISLIKKAAPKIYRLVENSSNISLEKITKTVYSNLSFLEVTESYLYNSYVFLIYTYYHFTTHLKRTKSIEGLEVVVEHIHKYENSSLSGLLNYQVVHHIDSFIPNNEEEKRAIAETKANLLKTEIHPFLKKSSDVKVDLNYNLILDKIIYDELFETYFPNKKVSQVLNHPAIDIEQYRSKIFTHGGISSLLGFLSGFLKNYGVFESQFDRPINQEDLISITDFMSTVYHRNKINLEEPQAIVILLVLSSLAKELKESSNLLKQNTSNSLTEVKQQIDEETQKQESDQVINELKSQLSQKDTEQKELLQRLANAESEIKRLETINRRQETELEKVDDLKTSLHHAQQFIFNSADSDTSLTEHPSDKNEEMIEYINNKKILVIGGHDSWVDKMKTVFPNFIYLTTEGATNRNLNQSQFDFALFNVNSNSHGAYYKIQQAINNSKIIYANYANINRTIHSIYQQIN